MNDLRPRSAWKPGKDATGESSKHYVESVEWGYTISWAPVQGKTRYTAWRRNHALTARWTIPTDLGVFDTPEQAREACHADAEARHERTA